MMSPAGPGHGDRRPRGLHLDLRVAEIGGSGFKVRRHGLQMAGAGVQVQGLPHVVGAGLRRQVLPGEHSPRCQISRAET